MPVDVPHPRRTHAHQAAAITTSFQLGDTTGVLTATAYADGSLAGIDLRVGKHGSTLAGIADAIAAATTLALQHGAPITELTEPWQDTRFVPAGETSDPDITHTTSLTDYLARRLRTDFPATGPAPRDAAALVVDPVASR